MSEMSERAATEDFSAKVEPMENSVDLTSRKKLFYDDFADAKVRLSDGKILRFSKDQLYEFTKSTVLRQLFDGDLSDEVTDILDANFDQFKLFLDCLIGLEPYSEENSIEIFPVAWKYQVDESLKEIYKGVIPTELNPNICHTLNMAKFYECKDLEYAALDFLTERHRYRTVLEKEEYYKLLSIKSYQCLLLCCEDEPMDSYLADCMFKWAENYLKINHPDQPINIRQFFEKFDFEDDFTPKAFETTGSIIRFLKSPLGKGYFSEDEIPDLLQQEFLKHGDSKWFFVNAGETITEKFWARVPFYKNSVSCLSIRKNNGILYDSPGHGNRNGKVATCKVEITGDQREFGFTITEGEWFWFSSRDIEIPSDFNGIKKINFTVNWTFEYPCRILKTSHNTWNFGEEELMLYFTEEPPFWYKTKMNVIQESESEEEEEEDSNSEVDMNRIQNLLVQQIKLLTSIIGFLVLRR